MIIYPLIYSIKLRLLSSIPSLWRDLSNGCCIFIHIPFSPLILLLKIIPKEICALG